MLLQRRIAAGDDGEQAGDLFTRGLAAENQHPFPRRIELIQRHLEKPLADMGRGGHQILERLLAKTTNREV